MGKRLRNNDLPFLIEPTQLSFDASRQEQSLPGGLQQYLIEQICDPIFVLATDGTIQYGNQAFLRNFQLSLSDVISLSLLELMPESDRLSWKKAIEKVLQNNQKVTLESASQTADKVFLTTLNPYTDGSGNISGLICVSKDITERKQLEEKLLKMSTCDLLTGLYNRNFFDVEMERLQLSRMFPVSIIVADMDLLKGINDRFGHVKGDEILKLVAQCIRQTFRAEDVTARIGGDEFGVLLPYTDTEAAMEILQRLRENLAKLDNPYISMSIGIATSRLEEELLSVYKRADEQMYREKMTQKYRR